jgi:hypothetical protein
LDAVGEPWKLDTGQNNLSHTKLVESSPVISMLEDPEPEPKDKTETDASELIVKRMERFSVTVNKGPGTKLGMTTCPSDGKDLIVCAIVGGLVQNFNSKQPLVSQVEVGDRIISFNGQFAPLHVLHEKITKATGKFTFEVQTHSKFIVNVRRGDEDKLGLHVTNKPFDHTLLINDIYPGVVRQWNNAIQCQQVAQGDRIVAVNGFTGPGQLLRRMVNEERGEISLTIARNGKCQDRPMESWRYP